MIRQRYVGAATIAYRLGGRNSGKSLTNFEDLSGTSLARTAGVHGPHTAYFDTGFSVNLSAPIVSCALM